MAQKLKTFAHIEYSGEQFSSVENIRKKIESKIDLFNRGEKYQVVEEMVKQVEKIKNDKIKIDNQVIAEILTVNGIRFSFEDGSWGLIRASSNKPSLVVVTESPTSDDRKVKIFKFIDNLLQNTGKIGDYDQKI